MKQNTLKTIPLLVGMLFLGLPYMTYAETVDDETTELETVHVQGKVLKKADVTGLGEIKKIAGKLQREQIENIRDSVRYDPGIGVNESGGRGTSRGYSIRGVEKERVAVTLDGMGSSQMVRRWSRNSTKARSSGAQNEIEYEDLKEIDIRKGASSLEGGSGALGGSISATTKDISDFLEDGQLFGGRFKTGYTSRDERAMASLGLALRIGDVEGFFQYTGRKGHETKAHKELYQGRSFIVNRSDANLPGGGRWFSADEVSGINPNAGGVRNVPNPMDYQSDSVLSKFGWHITPSHYLGAVVEHSRQTYDVREMFLANYWEASAPPVDNNGNALQKEDYLIFENTKNSQSPNYTPSRFYQDTHSNKRVGLEYRYRNLDGTAWLPDVATVQLDHRRLQVDTLTKNLACAKWPSVNPNCTLTQSGQMRQWYAVYTNQMDNRMQLSADKAWQFKDVSVQSRLKAGYGQMRFFLDDYYSPIDFIDSNGNLTNKDSGGYDPVQHRTAGPIKGKHMFISLNNRVDFNNGLSMSGGIRYDQHRYSASPTPEQYANGSRFTGSRYRNFSWDLGINYELSENLSLVYRNSSGFRVPSIVEQLGVYFANADSISADATQPPIKNSEKSINNEVGFKWQSSALRLSVSYFLSEYRDLIDYVAMPNSYEFYANVHHIKTQGFDINARVDAHTLWNRLPEGLEFFANLSQTKRRGKPAELDSSYTLISSYTLDAIQPFRIVYGVSYNHPDDKWGVNLTTTYSKGKSASELEGSSRQGGLSGSGSRSSEIITRSWVVTDLTGHYRPTKNTVLRAGVYNIFNYRYITWESARQTSYGMDVRVGTNNYLALAAPGRNYQISFEWKF